MATILIVDDEADVVRVAQASLSARGHDVHVARDGRGALALASTTTFDVAIVDRNLPKIDGAEVCRQLRANNQAMQVLMLTTSAIELNETVRPDGPNAFVMRPFLQDTLVNNVERLLAIAGRSSQAAS